VGDVLGRDSSGDVDGWRVTGDREGCLDGSLGEREGERDGTCAVGMDVVGLEGECDGEYDGCSVGTCVVEGLAVDGDALGVISGECDGAELEGATEGASVGEREGPADNGECVGISVGDVEGLRVGRSRGDRVGVSVAPCVG